VTRFPNNSRAHERRLLIHTCPISSQRWEAGCHNIAQLYRELVARGYTHSYQSVHEQLVGLLPEGKKNASRGADLAPTPLSSRQASFLFLRRPEELEADEQESLLTLRHLHPEVDLAYDLVQQFARMLRTRTGEQLDDWLEQVRERGIRELQDFVTGIERDKAAGVAGLTLPHNNGVVEGHVNKLKLIKRMMYGRARFALLRQRVLHAL
jgi:transposase